MLHLDCLQAGRLHDLQAVSIQNTLESSRNDCQSASVVVQAVDLIVRQPAFRVARQVPLFSLSLSSQPDSGLAGSHQ